MTEILLSVEFEMSQKAYQLYDNGSINEAVEITLSLEERASLYQEEYERNLCLKYAAPCLIDIGYAVQQKSMIERGIQYLKVFLEKHNEDTTSLAYEFYNIANGYFCAWKLNATTDIENGIDSEILILARRFYRQALNSLLPMHLKNGLACEIYTNYGNTLDSIGRTVEALDMYDSALAINPNMGMALGNKGVALKAVARVTRGVTHRFYLESIKLLQQAVKQPLATEVRIGFEKVLIQLQSVVAAHNHKMDAEVIEGISPKRDFHKFLCDFCARYGLFLSPVTMLGDDGRKYLGDPMFIERMTVKLTEPDKADRYVTFLNEIKQEYVLGRYFLVQSQFATSDLDAVDEGVLLIYPLDYSLHSVYIQLLKTALKQAISVLDKVAYFLYDYCHITTPPAHRVSFENMWGKENRLPEQLSSFKNPYLFALFCLAHDVSKNNDWNFIYEHRNALTHRFLVLHDMYLGDQQANRDIPRAQEDNFISQVIFATKIARAAVMYLILFVELEEQKLSSDELGVRPTVYATPLDKGFRHRPKH